MNFLAFQKITNMEFDLIQLEPVKQETVTEAVAQRFVRLLSEGLLRPGDKLPPERDLARQLQVGRTTVREVLKLLTLSGILEARRGDGTYVRRDFRNFLAQNINWLLLLSNREVNMIAEVREGLEVKAAGLAAIRASQEDLEKIAVFQKMSQINGRNIEIETDLDMQFHNAIALAAKNEILSNLMLSLQSFLRRYIAVASEMTDRLESTISEHETIYQAIASHNPQAAEQAMISHLYKSKEWILKANFGETE
jgi:GntR family transcriptional regulator, transcriptional repressor for pyruvate dehydrogenase complex